MRRFLKPTLTAITAAVVLYFLPSLISTLTSDPCPVRGVADQALFPKRSGFSDFGKAGAVSQWSRKYEVSCNTCHTNFARLNYYGEKFALNGFQDPGSEDGGTLGKKKAQTSMMDEVGNWLGARVNFEPLRWDTKGLTKDGLLTDQISLGRTPWLQFFTAGTIGKNISIFDELELAEGNTVKHGWFTLGFHNLGGAKGLVNLRAGRTSPKEFTSFSNRLRIVLERSSPIDKDTEASLGAPASGIGSSVESGTAATAGYSDPHNSVDYYGYAGPLWWGVGAGDPVTTNRNSRVNYWGWLRGNLEAGGLEGTNASIFYYKGFDSAASAATGTATTSVINSFYRIEPAFNIRWGGLDAIAAYVFGHEDNFNLSATTPTEEDFKGYTAIVAYNLTPKLRPTVQYDRVDYDTGLSRDKERVLANVLYSPIDQLNLVLSADFDIQEAANKNHKYLFMIRSMF